MHLIFSRAATPAPPSFAPEAPITPPADSVIPVSTYANGTKAPGTIAGWTNINSAVTTDGAIKVIESAGQDHKIFAVTNAIDTYDQKVTIQGVREGFVHLRYADDPDNVGKKRCITLQWSASNINPTGYATISMIKNLDPAALVALDTNGSWFRMTPEVTNLVANFGVNIDNWRSDKLVCQIKGFTITLDYLPLGNPANAVRIFKAMVWQALWPGKVAISTRAGVPVGDVTVEYDDQQVMASNRPLGKLQLSDLGVRTLMLSGSISAGQNVFTLDADLPAGLDPIGRVVGVPTGYEVGGPAIRGMKGVGGQQFDNEYANLAAANAARPQPDGTLAWIIDQGYVYKYHLGTNTWHPPGDVDLGSLGVHFRRWYSLKIAPKPLLGRVTSVGGAGNRQLTLADVPGTKLYSTCRVSVPAGTPLYFDNADLINPIGVAGVAGSPSIVPTDLTWEFPDGVIPILQPIYFPGRRIRWTVQGRGSGRKFSDWVYPTAVGHTIIQSPPGFESACFSWYATGEASGQAVAQHFEVRGNHYAGTTQNYPQSYGLRWQDEPNTAVWPDALRFLDIGVGGGYTRNVVARNVVIRDNFSRGCSFEASRDPRGEAILEINSSPQMMYLQWTLPGNSTERARFVECELHSEWMRGGYEWFAATADNRFDRLVCKNYVGSSNSSGGTGVNSNKFYDIRVKMTALYEDAGALGSGSYGSPGRNSPHLAPNHNADGSNGPLIKLGTEVKGMIVTYPSGYLTGGLPGDTDRQLNPVSINDNIEKWLFEDCIFKQMPFGPISNLAGNTLIVGAANNTLRRVAIVGSPTRVDFAPIYFYDDMCTNSTAIDCVADSIYYGNTAINGGGNRTNAVEGFDDVPNTITFTTDTGGAAGTLVDSNLVTLSGMTMNATFEGWSVETSGGFEGKAALGWRGTLGETAIFVYRDGSTTPGSQWFPMKNGDVFRLRARRPASGTMNVFLKRGGTTLATWVVTTV